MRKLAIILSMVVVSFSIVSCSIPENSGTSNTSVAKVSESNNSKSAASNVSNLETSELTSGDSDSETSKAVNVPADLDEIKLRIAYCTGEILEQYDATIDYIDNIGTEKLIFIAYEAKSGFSFVSIKWEMDNGFEKSGPSVDKTLFTVDNLTPKKPLVIMKTNIPETTTSDRGITFTDKDGNEKLFYISYSGLDELVLFEFDNK